MREYQLILTQVETGCRRVFDHRFRGAFAFGSRARGTEHEHSDLDVIIVLDRVNHYAAEVDRTSEIIAELSLTYGISISRVFLSEDEWLHGDTPFLRNVREEAIEI